MAIMDSLDFNFHGKKMMTKFKLLRNLPVARFYYQGESHSHPVRREVVLCEATPDMLIGYEIRSGNKVTSDLSVAPIKSFRRDRIAKYGDYQKLRRTTEQQSRIGQTTLTRAPLSSVKVKMPVRETAS